ncbi:MAG: hypothetical protein DWQ21_10330 [Bacteroidetes bacterium]|jgi:hypothetical protein|nr:MAG: hypothetical protein DWQ21_10330 [Bacteroidota bacterium]REK52247.1 MAG: hypothetical protein DWQ49_13360 [Bacteroidota bacterium]|tara:strand:+ start:47 stop:304 length:258 start_codon:yes stop_codon:yes gene_type:complete
MKDDDSQFSFRDLLTTLVPAGVLSWALAMLTASYMGYAKIDAAFISSLVTSVLAVYGISRKDDKETRKPDKKFIVESKDQTPPTK